MTHFGDTLLKGAVEWRGKPPTYRPGGLGETGERLNQALLAYVQDKPDTALSLAAEYTIGLVFNADYEDLTGLVELVNSWLFTPAFTLKIDGLTWKDLAWPDPFMLDLLETGRFQFKGKVEGVPNPDYPHNETYAKIVTWMGATEDLPAWFAVSVRDYGFPLSFGFIDRITAYDVPYPIKPFRAWMDTKGELTVSRGEAQARLLERFQKTLDAYIATEQDYVRDYPLPADTAAAIDGFVFANWAQGRFGTPKVT